MNHIEKQKGKDIDSIINNDQKMKIKELKNGKKSKVKLLSNVKFVTTK